MSDMPITIYHNPACQTSCKTLAALKERGHEPIVIEYLKVGWTREALQSLLAAMELGPRAILRAKGSLAAELGLLEPAATDDQIIDAMTKHPVLVERPIVSTRKGVRVCRPAERVYDLLD